MDEDAVVYDDDGEIVYKKDPFDMKYLRGYND